ncbi:hypothetical protein [Azospirillum picis]|uniref:Capsular polysaccharide synthesis protein n=1 Tax=Azospirillum picis TaxID=488438 RepID=A0ABU0MUG6_9PROT|nr:hypothetical protein [Azospirillum picis]MBP2303052.1 hypothetical protein [Azospirillum picis]MDQ0536834.1 hypothetical protein [Azospirillum picis]
MTLAILFWFYKDFGVCENRLSGLRARNPGVPIYGLYGGEAAQAPEAERRLGRWFDDFYAFVEPRGAQWKWQHGDQLIAAWHRDRGATLAWDSLVIVQWDMLLLAPLRQLFAAVKPGEALFSGLRPEREVADWWGWLNGIDPDKRADRDAFRAYLAERHGYRGELLCCLFIVVCLPRRFLDLYVAEGPPEVGFLEYKLPTLARVYGIPFCENHPYRPWWASDPATRQAPARERLLNAVGEDVSFDTVLAEMARPEGGRIIHPYRKPFPNRLPPGRPAGVLALMRRLGGRAS